MSPSCYIYVVSNNKYVIKLGLISCAEWVKQVMSTALIIDVKEVAPETKQ